MRVLVGYATVHGSTRRIAEEISNRLMSGGLETDLLAVDAISSIDKYDALVVGSAVHNMAWLPDATTFVQSRAADLAARPVWLFSVSSVGATSSFFGPRVARLMRRMRKEPKNVAGFRRLIQPRDHRAFAGAVERSHWNLAGHLFLMAFGGRYGDHRDSPDIDAWADSIAHQLLAAETYD
ncbi:MAG: flavodoxin domain-containing protein [Acidimicrobiia bacterium]